MKHAKTLEKIRSAHHQSWMGKASNVTKLSATVRYRQETLLRTRASDEGRAMPAGRFVPPFTVEILAGELKAAVGADGDVPTHALPISIHCALLAELLASALCSDEQAGGIYPKASRDHDEKWAQVHQPISVLRNALFHPGAVLPDKKDRHDLLAGTHVSRLAYVVERGTVKTDRGSDFRRLAHALQRSPAEVTSADMALWSVLQLDAIGRFEAARIEMALDVEAGGE